jgi:hypothetical protein
MELLGLHKDCMDELIKYDRIVKEVESKEEAEKEKLTTPIDVKYKAIKNKNNTKFIEETKPIFDKIYRKSLFP